MGYLHARDGPSTTSRYFLDFARHSDWIEISSVFRSEPCSLDTQSLFAPRPHDTADTPCDSIDGLKAISKKVLGRCRYPVQPEACSTIGVGIVEGAAST